MKIVEITKSGLDASKEMLSANISHIILYEDSRPYKLVVYFVNKVYKTFEFETTSEGLDMYNALASFWLGDFNEDDCWCFSINVDKNGKVTWETLLV